MDNMYCYGLKATEVFYDNLFGLKWLWRWFQINAELIAATSTLIDINIKECWVIKRPI